MGVLVIDLPERIDTNNSDFLKDTLFEKIDSATDFSGIELNAEKLNYISSAGLRVLLSVKKKYNTDIKITEVSKDVYDIFDVTGFNQMLNVEKKKREISIEGCEIIGKGFCGTVYRLDPETIIKVYNSNRNDTLKIIENEKKMAKLAFVNGVPTAISYDIVKVGDNYGSVFELLNAKSFNDLVIQNPEEAENITTKFVDFLKHIHKIKIEDKMLPSAKKKFVTHLGYLEKYFEKDVFEKLNYLLDTIEDTRNVVHGDSQMKNIMMVNNEPMFIDMDTLCAGKPIFDLQALFATYIAFAEDEPENTKNFLGIEIETAEIIWNRIINYYFEEKSDEEKAMILDKIKILGYIRMMDIVNGSKMLETDIGKLRIKHSIEHIKDLSARYDDLII